MARRAGDAETVETCDRIVADVLTMADRLAASFDSALEASGIEAVPVAAGHA